jgi:hypothetical protein
MKDIVTCNNALFILHNLKLNSLKPRYLISCKCGEGHLKLNSLKPHHFIDGGHFDPLVDQARSH